MTKKEQVLFYYLSNLKNISNSLLENHNERDRRLEWLIQNVENRLKEVRNDKTRNVR